MNDVVPIDKFNHEVPELPVLASTRSGVLFDPRAERWVIRDTSATFSFDFAILQGISTSIKLVFQQVLLWYVKNLSPHHTMNMFRRFEHFLRTAVTKWTEPLEVIGTNEIINYRAALSKRDQWYLGSLSGLLQKWHSLGYPGVTDDAVDLLKQLRIKGNIKGEAVLTADPERGSFTDIEVEAIQAALEKARLEGQISLEYYVLVSLYLLLGQRSVQYSALKVCDVGVAASRDGVPIYTLRVPRAKQREQLSRTEFKDRILIPKIGTLLVSHAKQIEAEFTGKLFDPSEAPLFPAKQSRANEPKGFKFHRTSLSLAASMERSIAKLHVISERTGTLLHITAVRFRRTIGTRAATEGHGELVIAELLDHTDTQNVGVYAEATPGIAERIDRAIAMQLAPMAQAFAGKIISDESEASRAGDPSSRICGPQFSRSMKPMGNCGKHGFCGAFAPISCYTCSNFQPWLDGPHEIVLTHLISERERLLESSGSRVASINDRTILAVAEVVRLCEEITRHGETS